MRLRRRHKELATNKVSFAIVAISQFQSAQQLHGDGVKVRGWQSDSLEPAAFEHSWYLCYKALVEGWEQVRVTRMRSTCTPRTRDIEGSRPLGFTAQLQFLVVARFQPATSHRFPYGQAQKPPGSTPSGLQ